MTKKNDSYYEEESLKAIGAALSESEGKQPDEIRFAIRRAYPFGSPRRGRPYKIWQKNVLRIEAKLGMAPKKHKKKNEGFEDLFDETKNQPERVVSSMAMLRRTNE